MASKTVPVRGNQQYSIPKRAKAMLRFIRSEVFLALRPLNMFYGTRNDAHSDEAQHALLERGERRRAASFHRECDFMSVCGCDSVTQKEKNYRKHRTNSPCSVHRLSGSCSIVNGVAREGTAQQQKKGTGARTGQAGAGKGHAKKAQGAKRAGQALFPGGETAVSSSVDCFIFFIKENKLTSF